MDYLRRSFKTMPSPSEEYMNSLFQFTRKWCLKRHHIWNKASKHSNFLSSEYHIEYHQYLDSLTVLSLNFDWEKSSLHQRTICLYDFMVKVKEYKIGASFIALGIFLKLSNKWTKETSWERKNWFLHYGPRSVLPLKKCTVWGLYPLLTCSTMRQVRTNNTWHT